MITLSNGHSFEYMVASGALAFDGQGWAWEKPLVWLGYIRPELFTVVIKSVTRQPREGNLRWSRPWDCMRFIPGGAVNKVGLTNPGIEYWCKKIGPKLDFEKFPLVGSIFGDNKKDLVEMAIMFNDFDFKAIEVNVSCPNADHPSGTRMIVDSVREVTSNSRHPVIVKVSVDQDYISIARGLIGWAEAISLNSVPWKIAFPYSRSPLWELESKVGGGGGGVSGRPAQIHNWTAIAKLSRDNALPVIGASVMNEIDVTSLRYLGAKAISFGTIHMRTPWKPTSIVEKEMGCE